MVRTIVSLDDDDKAWLDRAARSQRVPMTKLVRHAIRRLRQEQEAAPQGFERLLRETAGTWKAGDGLAYQRLLRADAAIADSAAALRGKHRWKLPDAFQAALALGHRLKLATRDQKDFPPRRHRFVVVPYQA